MSAAPRFGEPDRPTRIEAERDLALDRLDAERAELAALLRDNFMATTLRDDRSCWERMADAAIDAGWTKP